LWKQQVLGETDYKEDNNLFAANVDLNINEEFEVWFQNEDLSLISSRHVVESTYIIQ
jgi:hypothetical protein